MKRSISCISISIFFFSFFSIKSTAQSKSKIPNLVYADKQGVLRYTSGKAEASFFGVNYTTPFAYAYRAHKAPVLDRKSVV